MTDTPTPPKRLQICGTCNLCSAEHIADECPQENEMNNQLSINIFLTEKFLGKCWHDFKGDTPTHYGRCVKCWLTAAYETLPERGGCVDLFTPSGFFLLWEKAQKEEWWRGFKIRHGCWSEGADMWVLPEERINPLVFPTLIAEYLGWGKP